MSIESQLPTTRIEYLNRDMSNIENAVHLHFDDSQKKLIEVEGGKFHLVDGDKTTGGQKFYQVLKLIGLIIIAPITIILLIAREVNRGNKKVKNNIAPLNVDPKPPKPTTPKEPTAEERNRAAVQIQKVIRGYLSKTLVEKRKGKQKKQQEKQNAAAITIQSMTRSHLAKTVVNKMILQKIEDRKVQEAKDKAFAEKLAKLEQIRQQRNIGVGQLQLRDSSLEGLTNPSIDNDKYLLDYMKSVVDDPNAKERLQRDQPYYLGDVATASFITSGLIVSGQSINLGITTPYKLNEEDTKLLDSIEYPKSVMDARNRFVDLLLSGEWGIPTVDAFFKKTKLYKNKENIYNWAPFGSKTASQGLADYVVSVNGKGERLGQLSDNDDFRVNPGQAYLNQMHIDENGNPKVGRHIQEEIHMYFSSNLEIEDNRKAIIEAVKTAVDKNAEGFVVQDHCTSGMERSVIFANLFLIEKLIRAGVKIDQEAIDYVFKFVRVRRPYASQMDDGIKSIQRNEKEKYSVFTFEDGTKQRVDDNSGGVKCVRETYNRHVNALLEDHEIAFRLPTFDPKNITT